MTAQASEVFQHLIWAAVAVLFIARASTVAKRWLDLIDPAHRASIGMPVQIPDDLLALAMGESEKWAQDSTIETIRQRFDKLGDWNKVRSALGVALKD